MKSLFIICLSPFFPLFAFSQDTHANSKQVIKSRVIQLENIQHVFPEERTDYNRGFVKGLYEACRLIEEMEKIENENEQKS